MYKWINQELGQLMPVANTGFPRLGEPGAQPRRAMGFIFRRCKDNKGKKVVIDLSRPPGPVLLNFWEPSCEGCVYELPDLQKIHRDFRRKGLFVVGVSTSDVPEIMEIVRKKGLTYRQVRDEDLSMKEKFGVTYIPRTFLIDKKGIIRDDLVGTRSYDQFRAALRNVDLLPVDRRTGSDLISRPQ